MRVYIPMPGQKKGYCMNGENWAHLPIRHDYSGDKRNILIALDMLGTFKRHGSDGILLAKKMAYIELPETLNPRTFVVGHPQSLENVRINPERNQNWNIEVGAVGQAGELIALSEMFMSADTPRSVREYKQPITKLNYSLGDALSLPDHLRRSRPGSRISILLWDVDIHQINIPALGARAINFYQE